ncbi:MAG: helix-turn-helix transcriptional regulator [Proteobacteria bacterium]|nr:helix-turn-helix transcriptional regulator [Pseudomonadota bacterium]
MRWSDMAGDLFKDFEWTSRILSGVPGLVVWMLPDAQFMCANQRAISAMGFTGVTQLVNRYPRDMKNESSKLHDQFVKNTRYVFQNQCSVMSVYSVYLADQRWALFIGEEQPLVDVNQSIIGVCSHTMEVTTTPIASHLAQLFIDHRKKSAIHLQQGLYHYSERYEHWNLSQRQGECLFWLLKRKSASEIGALLGLTKRTVESYIRLIKSKFQVHTWSELSDFADEQGLQSYIPKHWIYSNK